MGHFLEHKACVYPVMDIYMTVVFIALLRTPSTMDYIGLIKLLFKYYLKIPR